MSSSPCRSSRHGHDASPLGSPLLVLRDDVRTRRRGAFRSTIPASASVTPSRRAGRRDRRRRPQHLRPERARRTQGRDPSCIANPPSSSTEAEMRADGARMNRAGGSATINGLGRRRASRCTAPMSSPSRPRPASPIRTRRRRRLPHARRHPGVLLGVLLAVGVTAGTTGSSALFYVTVLPTIYVLAMLVAQRPIMRHKNRNVGHARPEPADPEPARAARPTIREINARFAARAAIRRQHDATTPAKSRAARTRMRASPTCPVEHLGLPVGGRSRVLEPRPAWTAAP